MGQTLTHGVYLPDEGERNCYSGLAANWQILDTSVGTIAEHTSALAGKANAVHTHGKSDITDFPAYGNAAGTICEGNDSRLSDARTPVAHTHTKSDVTDLLNSDFIPSANNSYNLGSSSYQWNNLYAKNYYYNGTPWGLDKENVWTQIQEIRAASESTGLYFSSYHGQVEYNTCGTSNYKNYNCFLKLSSNRYDNTIGIYRSVGRLGDTEAGATLHDIDTSFAYYDIHIAAKYMQIMQNTQFINNDTVNQVIPSVTNTTDLGTSDNKWKTLNGINPGALSIFNPSASYDPIDIPTSWDTLGASWNTLSVSNLGDGWLCITYNNCSAGDYILVRFGGTSGSSYPSLRFEAVKNSNNKYFIYALFPVAKAFSNIYLEMLINSNANLILHHYIPAYGTV